MPTAIEYQNKWGSGFGDDYQARNSITKDERIPIWRELINGIKFDSVLEVGCSRGHNLYSIKYLRDWVAIQGIEINEKAIKERYVDNIVKGSAYELPFVDGQFEFVYTAGVLIHLADTLKAIQEIYRVSKRYILSVEYFTETERDIDYRQDVYCIARNFKKLWLDTYPDLKVVKEGNTKDFGIVTRHDDFSTSCGYIILEKK